MYKGILPNAVETAEMFATIGVQNMEELISKTVPLAIRANSPLQVAGPVSEFEYLIELKNSFA